MQFNGQPHSYMRFSLAQNMEGDNSNVEMKVSSDVDEEAGGNGVGEHLNHSRDKSYEPQKSGRQTRKFVILGVVIATFFCLGEDAPPDAATSGQKLVYGDVTLDRHCTAKLCPAFFFTFSALSISNPTGIVIGYFSQSKNNVPSTTQAATQGSTLCEEQRSFSDSDTDPAPIMNWNLVKSFLAKNISPDTMESAFR